MCGRVAGWSSQVARRAHNPKVAGSNPAPATHEGPANAGLSSFSGVVRQAQSGNRIGNRALPMNVRCRSAAGATRRSTAADLGPTQAPALSAGSTRLRLRQRATSGAAAADVASSPSAWRGLLRHPCASRKGSHRRPERTGPRQPDRFEPSARRLHGRAHADTHSARRHRARACPGPRRGARRRDAEQAEKRSSCDALPSRQARSWPPDTSEQLLHSGTVGRMAPRPCRHDSLACRLTAGRATPSLTVTNTSSERRVRPASTTPPRTSISVATGVARRGE